MNLNAMLAVEHPSGKGVCLSQTIHKRTKADSLHNSAHAHGAGSTHHDLEPTTQLRPCHPTWITLPSSTRMGTIRRLLSSDRKRSRASASASMSYSTNSFRVHSSHSRSSSV